MKPVKQKQAPVKQKQAPVKQKKAVKRLNGKGTFHNEFQFFLLNFHRALPLTSSC